MSQMISFLDSQVGSSCKKAVAPIILQDGATFAADGSGDSLGAAPVIVADIAALDPAHYGGQIVTRGCKDVLVELQYLDGDDCEPCTDPDALALIPISVIVPANSSFPLPDGFWQDLQVTLVDDAAAPVDLTGTAVQNVMVYSCYTPECPECAVMAI